MASTTENANNLSLVMEIEGIPTTYLHDSFNSIEYYNQMNSKPVFNFLVTDAYASYLREASLLETYISFINTSDNEQKKLSTFTTTLNSLENIKIVANSPRYNMQLESGSKTQLIKSSYYYVGNSIKVLKNILNKFNFKYSNPYSINTHDEMTWRFVQSDMWQMLDACINKSYINGDYAFYAIDDVNEGVMKVSSIETEMNQDIKYLFSFNENSRLPTNIGKNIVDGVTIYNFSKYSKRNELGLNKDKLFPNVSISSVYNGNRNSTTVKNKCFSDVLKDNGITGQDRIKESLGIPDDAVYGERIIRRHYDNNVHRNYVLADIIRDYTLATYAKTLEVVLYNQIGPSIGSKVAVIIPNDNYRGTGDVSIDMMYSDLYIVYSKLVTYSNSRSDIISGERGVNNDFSTVIKLISKNLTNGDLSTLYKNGGKL